MNFFDCADRTVKQQIRDTSRLKMYGKNSLRSFLVSLTFGVLRYFVESTAFVSLLCIACLLITTAWLYPDTQKWLFPTTGYFRRSSESMTFNIATLAIFWFYYVVTLLIYVDRILLTLKYYYYCLQSYLFQTPESKFRNPDLPDMQKCSAAYPRIAVQLPMYNEREYCQSAIDHSCSFIWPREKLTIQVRHRVTTDSKLIVRRFWMTRLTQRLKI